MKSKTTIFCVVGALLILGTITLGCYTLIIYPKQISNVYNKAEAILGANNSRLPYDWTKDPCPYLAIYSGTVTEIVDLTEKVGLYEGSKDPLDITYVNFMIFCHNEAGDRATFITDYTKVYKVDKNGKKKPCSIRDVKVGDKVSMILGESSDGEGSIKVSVMEFNIEK